MQLRTRAHGTVDRARIGASDIAVDGARVRDAADSIATVGLIYPLILDASDTLSDGFVRLQALDLLGETSIPVLWRNLPAETPLQQVAFRTHSRKHPHAPRFHAKLGRSSLERIEKIAAIALDSSLPVSLRTTAAESLERVDAGAPINTHFTAVMDAKNDSSIVARYPQLAHLDSEQALRMGAYLDAFSPEDRQTELDALQLTAPAGVDANQMQAMAIYTHMQQLAASIDQEQANEVAAALAAAATGRGLSPALRGRCLEVANLLQHTADGIRAAIDQEAA